MALPEGIHCLTIDAHSYPSKPLPYEPDQRAHRPEICIGTDDFHTLRWPAEGAVELFRAHFDPVEVNRPHSGALVPEACFQRDPRVYSIMVEVNRSLHMDELTGARVPAFDNTANDLRAALALLIDIAQ